MRNLFFIFCSLFLFISCQLPTEAKWYDPQNYDEFQINKLLPIPAGVNYSSNNTCVNLTDLKKYNYTDYGGTVVNYKKVIPENYCYSMLSYNISREDFFNIVDKNVQAFYNYRKLITLWTIFNYTNLITMEDQCAGFFRYLACWTQFPACVDNGDGTWTASTICEHLCNIYLVRCGDFAVKTFCNKTSSLDYCAGFQSSSFLYFSFLNLFILLIFLI